MTTAEAGGHHPGDAGFALVEMLVALSILSLVGLTLARFQTFQLRGSSSIALAAGARIEADNRIVDALVMPRAPTQPVEGESENLGRRWHWAMQPAPPPEPALTPDLVSIEVQVRAAAGGPVLARRIVLRPRILGGEDPAGRPA